MFKLFRYSNLVLRLCKSKHFHRILDNNKLALSELNLLQENGKLWKKLYTTEQLQNTTTEDNTENEGPVCPDTADIESLTRGNPELEQKLKVIILEAEVMRQEGRNTPSNSFLKSHHWEELLKMPTRTARKKYLSFLFKVEKIKENEMLKKEQRRLQKENEPKYEPKSETGHIIYSLINNNIFLRFYDTTINNFYNSKLIEAIMFGQQLVVDCGYDKNMTTRENANCAKQLMLLFSENRMHDDPFDLHLCNVDKESVLTKSLHRHIKTMYEPSFPLNIHEISYTDIFPKEKLIYLTPHCKEEMLEYDHDAIYIIGGIVDKVNTEPLSLAKAKREGLKMRKLPLDRYLQWGAGSGKTLTLNQIVCILLDVKKTGDWTYALRHVPKRKIVMNFPEEYPNIGKARTLSYDKDEGSRGNKINRSMRPYNRISAIDEKSTKRKVELKSIFNDKYRY